MCLAACAAPREVAAPTPPDRIFHADPRWLGGDAAISIALGGDRILWLFGDSFVDPLPPYTRREAAFPRNTVAVQTGRDPAAATMQFAWRSTAGAPSAFFAGLGADWYWPGGGTLLDDGTLAVFLHRVRATEAAPPLGFESAGYAVALIANPDAPPAAWHGRIVAGPSLPFDALPGAAVLRDGAYVLVLAVRQTGGPAGAFMRLPAASLAKGDLAAIEWWTAKGWAKTAALGDNGPAFVIDDAGAESSLHWDACAKAFVHVASYGFGAAVIGRRTAPRLTGPWSAPETVFRPPESDAPNPFVYAGRAHAELKTPRGTTALTYVANSFTPDDVLTPAGEVRLYWPRLAMVPAPRCD